MNVTCKQVSLLAGMKNRPMILIGGWLLEGGSHHLPPNLIKHPPLTSKSAPTSDRPATALKISQKSRTPLAKKSRETCRPKLIYSMQPRTEIPRQGLQLRGVHTITNIDLIPRRTLASAGPSYQTLPRTITRRKNPDPLDKSQWPRMMSMSSTEDTDPRSKKRFQLRG